MSTWRYVQNGQPAAPVDMAALQALLTQGTLAPDTYVWQEGMTNWIAAKNLPEFANCRPAMVPPVPTGTAVPPLPATPKASAPPAAPASAAEDVEKNRAFAIVAYFGIFFLVPLLAAPSSRFAKYHANQGMVLFLASLAATVGSYILGVILVFIPFLGVMIAGLLGLSLLVGVVAMVIIGIVNAAGGQCKPLPVIGHFELIK